MVFMGDTGSLSLGGALGTISVITKHELVLAIIGGFVCARDRLSNRAGGFIQVNRETNFPNGSTTSSF